MKYRNHILVGDARQQLKQLPDARVHLILTSPPYFGLRDYGTAKWINGDPLCDHQSARGAQGKTGQRAGRRHTQRQIFKTVCGKCGAVRVDRQIGNEETPEEYVRNLVRVFRELRRVLRPDGCVFLNLGDTYASNCATARKRGRHTIGQDAPKSDERFVRLGGFKNKDRMGIPHRVVFALQSDGWWWRDEIIWHKRNGMTCSVEDRTTPAHEMVFLLTKKPHYFFDIDAIMEPLAPASKSRYKYEFGGTKDRNGKVNKFEGARHAPDNRFPRSVWSISCKSFKGAHFATMSPRLAEKCILAGTSDKGCCPKCGSPWRRIVKRKRVATRTGQDSKVTGTTAEVHGNRDPLRHVTKRVTRGWKPGCNCGKRPMPCLVYDPFFGAGTTGVVAKKLGRDWCGSELNPAYAQMAQARIDKVDAGFCLFGD